MSSELGKGVGAGGGGGDRKARSKLGRAAASERKGLELILFDFSHLHCSLEGLHLGVKI